MGESILKWLVDEFGAGVAVTVASLVAYRILLLVNRKRKLRFFGISSRCPELTVYLSHLVVTATTGLEELSKGYRGPAVQKSEFDGAVMVREELKGSQVVRRIREWLGRWFVSIAPVEPAIEISPAKMSELSGLPHHNVISLGSQVYNSLFRKHNEESKYFRFEKRGDTRGIVVTFGRKNEQFLTREDPRGSGVIEREIGVIERVNDPAHERTLFYCAGLGSSATMGCVRYLVQHWKELYEEHGLDEFALYLIFPDQEDPDAPTIQKDPEVVRVKHGKRPTWWKRLF